MWEEEEEEEESKRVPIYTTAQIDTESGLDETYHPALLQPTPEMIEARLATERLDEQLRAERGEDKTSPLDAVARLGLICGKELDDIYYNALSHIIKSCVCPDITRRMLEDDIMKFPRYQSMEPVKRAVILYALWMFVDLQREFSTGLVGGGVQHETIDEETMSLFVEGGLKEAIEPLLKCIGTPHQFVDRVMKMVEDGGVHGYVHRSLHA